MSDFERQAPPSEHNLIVNELVGLIAKNEEIKRMDGERAADAHWIEVRKSYIFGEAIPDEVFVDYVHEAMRIMAIAAREARDV